MSNQSTGPWIVMSSGEYTQQPAIQQFGNFEDNATRQPRVMGSLYPPAAAAPSSSMSFQPIMSVAGGIQQPVVQPFTNNLNTATRQPRVIGSSNQPAAAAPSSRMSFQPIMSVAEDIHQPVVQPFTNNLNTATIPPRVMGTRYQPAAAAPSSSMSFQPIMSVAGDIQQPVVQPFTTNLNTATIPPRVFGSSYQPAHAAAAAPSSSMSFQPIMSVAGGIQQPFVQPFTNNLNTDIATRPPRVIGTSYPPAAATPSSSMSFQPIMSVAEDIQQPFVQSFTNNFNTDFEKTNQISKMMPDNSGMHAEFNQGFSPEYRDAYDENSWREEEESDYSSDDNAFEEENFMNQIYSENSTLQGQVNQIYNKLTMSENENHTLKREMELLTQRFKSLSNEHDQTKAELERTKSQLIPDDGKARACNKAKKTAVNINCYFHIDSMQYCNLGCGDLEKQLIAITENGGQYQEEAIPNCVNNSTW